MPGRQYTTSGTSRVGSDGTATVSLGPGYAREEWEVTRVTVFLDGSDDGEIYLYEGDASPGNFLEASYVGVRNSCEFAPGTLILSSGEFLTFEWILATEGAVATARLRYALQ